VAIPAVMPPVLTIGHSTHPIEKFIAILQAHHVECVADVRTVPHSRRNPQFEQEALARSLRNGGIDYEHMPALGGLRHARKDSMNTAWQNASFRGYADYMRTPAFSDALARLTELANTRRVVIMCAESLPWRCHRSLVADALIARGVPVEHIMSAASRKAHMITSFARVEGTEVTYPGLPGM
jgi:uncharacterized protein (DUF488 family)